MGLATRSPLRMAGANVASGCPNTGEVQFTLGGAQRYCVYSGIPSGAFALSTPPQAGAPAFSGADCLIFSGPGRIKDIVLHTQLASGLPIVFYDTGVVISGGPIAASGHPIVAVAPGTWAGGTPGSGTPILWNGTPYGYDIPFNSGLAVAVKSGQPGFTCVFTPETNQSNPTV